MPNKTISNPSSISSSISHCFPTPPRLPEKIIQKVIDQVFDQSEFDNKLRVYEGGFNKQLILQHGIFLESIEYEESLLSDWIDAWGLMLRKYFLVDKAKGEVPIPADHTSLLDTMNEILGVDGWTGKKYKAPQKPPPRKRIPDDDPNVGTASSKSGAKRQKTKNSFAVF